MSSHQVLKIAQIIEASSAGVGRHVIDLTDALAARGHSIDVIFSSRRMDARFSTALNSLSGPGVAFHEVDMRHAPSLADTRSISTIRRHLREQGPFDIVHTHSTKAGLLGRIAAFGLPCRNVYTPHAFYSMSGGADTMRRRLAMFTERTLARTTHAVICVSAGERDHARDIGIADDKLFVVHNGIANSPAAGPRLQRDEVVVGFVGRLCPQKCPQLLMQAIAGLAPEQLSKTRVVFVGAGPVEPLLKAEMETFGLQRQVVFAGAQPGAEAMAGFDIFALPSRYEGFPYVLLEALNAGLPAVATRVGGVAEMVVSGENGFLVPVGGALDFGAALAKLIASPELRRQMGEASRVRARRFGLDAMVNGVMNVYRAALLHAPQSVLSERSGWLHRLQHPRM